MTKHSIHKILTTTALCLAAVGLSSCATVIDTGSTLDNVGKQAPDRLLVKEDSWHKEAPLVAWKKGETY